MKIIEWVVNLRLNEEPIILVLYIRLYISKYGEDRTAYYLIKKVN